MVILCVAGFCSAQTTQKVTYSQAQAVFVKHCLACHDSKQAEGKLVMESRDSLLKGGEDGAVIVVGHADQSVLVQQIEHAKKPFMPPKKAKDTLDAQEIALIRGWIDGGAPGPAPGEVVPVYVPVPRIVPQVAPRKPIRAIAYSAAAKLAAIAQDDSIELMSLAERSVTRRLSVGKGNVNALAFSTEGATLVAGAGEPGITGEIDVFNVDGTMIQRLQGHKDAVYSVAISVDGKTLASGSYDNSIILWNLESAKPSRTLEGHNGAVLGLAFRPDGAVLASASADRTVKLWDTRSGERLDTFAESVRELNCVLFTADGSRVIAGGGDNRIRIWQIGPTAKEGTNHLLVAQFAHEGAILRLALSPDGKTIVSAADDKTVKFWDAQPDVSSGAPVLKELKALAPQSDWPAALAFASGPQSLIVGRLDGSLALYDPASGNEIAPPKPQLDSIEPRGAQRGKTVSLHLSGKHLGALTGLAASDPRITAKVIAEHATPDGADVELSTPADLAAGAYDLKVSGPGGESNATRLWIDDLPQVFRGESQSPDQPTVVQLPSDCWGSFAHRGEVGLFAFDAAAGQPFVLDVASQRLGSKAKVLLEVLDSSGQVLTSASGFDNDPEPLLSFTPSAGGKYLARLSEIEAAASPEHFYRLSIGSFAFVTGCYPLAVSRNSDVKVQLLGLNCPGSEASFHTGSAGEMDVPLDASKFRVRRPIKLLVEDGPQPLEIEPDDTPDHAMPIAVPGSVNGRIGYPGDVDLFRFEAKAGQDYILETLAARRFSPVDTRIEVLNPDGSPVERVKLRAVRDSAITFRGFDADAGGARLLNWQEMDLNQYLYMSGEVVKLFLAPRGPDSEFGFYTIDGRRRCYFDTTPTAHALDEHCYIVEPHAPGEQLPPNGLPVFTIYYANDDDCLRKLGADSRLTFTPPADGSYLVRVTDARGFGSDRHVYRLTIRPAAPDFNVSLALGNAAVPPGAGVSFAVNVDRIDGFDGPVTVQITGVPPGFVASTPIVVEAGHTVAQGTLWASLDAPAPTDANAAQTKATATAIINGKPVTRELGGFGKISLGPKPPMLIALEPANAPATQLAQAGSIPEITVVAGQYTPARLSVKRNDFKGEITFEVDNLPHGVIVADIGLNGVLIPEDQAQRQIFLHCAPWVGATDRLCYARATNASGVTSRPVLIHVRPAIQQAQGK